MEQQIKAYRNEETGMETLVLLQPKYERYAVVLRDYEAEETQTIIFFPFASFRDGATDALGKADARAQEVLGG